MPSGPSWSLYATLYPHDRSLITQVVKPDPKGGKHPDLYGWQEKPNRTAIVTRYEWRLVRYKATERMWIVGGGHGYPMQLQRVGDRMDVRFRQYQGPWCRVPFVAGKTWHSYDLASHRDGPINVPPVPLTTWDQGCTAHDGTWYVLCGVPMKASGPTLSPPPRRVRRPNIPGRVKVIRDGRIVDRIDVAHLGREGLKRTGRPIGSRLEPEGIGLLKLPAGPHLLVGIANGPVGRDQRHTMYVLSL